MMSPFEGGDGIDVWITEACTNIKTFERDELFDLLATETRVWWAELFEAQSEAIDKLTSILNEAATTQDGCREFGQKGAQRISIRGKRIYAYQLVYWAGNALLPSAQDVVRHKCHNRRCINPSHLTHGSQADNRLDELERRS